MDGLREARMPVRLSVRVQTDFGRVDALVQNVSSRGMMATCATPPPRGSYVEVRSGSYVVVARVCWSSSDRFGIFAQDKIAFSGLAASVAPTGQGRRDRIPPQPERSRVRHEGAAEIGTESARMARLVNLAAVAAVAIASAVVVADTASQVFGAPLQKVSAALLEAE